MKQNTNNKNQNKAPRVSRFTSNTLSLRNLQRQVASIRGMLNSEQKTLQIIATNASATSAGTLTCLNALAQGTDDGSRIGNSVLPKSLICSFYTRYNTSSTDNFNFIRIILFRDLNDEADTAPTMAQLLATTTTNQLPVTQYNVLYQDRFVILTDQVMPLSLYQTNLAFQVTHTFNRSNVNSSYRFWHCTYNGTATTDVSKNALYALIIGSGSTNMHGYSYDIRFTYHDN